MLKISLDFESRSRVELTTVGGWEYCRHPSTMPMCLAWAPEGQEPSLWHPAFSAVGLAATAEPTQLFEAIKQGALLYAWNVSFERQFWQNVMVDVYGWPEVPDSQWRCTMAKALAYALPADLERAALALGTIDKKDKAGKTLMLRLCKPRKPTKSNPAEWHEPTREELLRLFDYCRQDVRTERAISEQLKDLSEYELAVWQLDQKINQRGVPVDRELCEAAVKLDVLAKADLGEQLKKATKGAIEKVDRAPMIAWLKANGVQPPKKLKKKKDKETGKVSIVEIETVETKSLKKLFAQELPTHVKRAVELYMAANKTSVTKYKTMLERSATTGRLYEMFAYHKASTGRWAGRGVQLHNLPRPPESMSNMDELAKAILGGDYEWLQFVYGQDQVPTVLSSALRAALTASPGRRLMAADFSAVETRGAAWIANDEELLEVFRKLDADPKANWDVYTWQASRILGRQVTKKDKDDRQNWGKVPVLAGVYQGSGRVLSRYAWDNFSTVIPLADANKIVREFRRDRAAIVKFWKTTEDCATEAVRRRHLKDRIVEQGRLRWKVIGRFLQCRLPSGRRLSYLDPKLEWKTIEFDVLDDDGNYVETKKFEKETITFSGSNEFTGNWERTSTYGGKLTENIVQALCRDLLADAMLRQDRAGYELVLHVHDESVADVPEGARSLHEFESLMGQVPDWADGFPLRAEGWVSRRFRK